MIIRGKGRFWSAACTVMVLTVLLLLSGAIISSARVWATETEAPVVEKTPKLSSTSLSMKQFDTKVLRLKNVKSGVVRWACSDTRACTVTIDPQKANQATIQAIGGAELLNSGATTISCKVSAIYNNKSYSCNIVITPLNLNTTDLQLVVRRSGYTLKLNNNAASGKTSWQSTNNSVATVDQSGNVTAKAAGSCRISATWNNETVFCTVQVSEASVSSLRAFRSPSLSSNRGKVILAGSGLMDHWGLDAYTMFGSTTIINNAVSESMISDWSSWYKKLITDYQPKAVVISIGTADIKDGHSGKYCGKYIAKVIEKIHKKSKKTKILVCSLPKYPSQKKTWDEVQICNVYLRDYCKKKSFAIYLNVNKVLVRNGKPVSSKFSSEHAVLTKRGYKALKSVIVPRVKKVI